MTRLARSTLIALVLVLAPFAQRQAHATTIYKCTDAKGTVTLQNDTPCKPGEKQEVRTIGALPTAPAPAERAVEVKAPSGPPPNAHFELVRGPVTESLPVSQIPLADRKPPPPLFECKVWDLTTYLSEADTPQERCVPLATVGLNGGGGAGEACEIRRDTCTALTGEALCTAWQRRVDEANFRMTYAAPADKDARKAEYERQRAALVDSTCR
ncbi:DUF4142 domain containing protein [Lysobacter dokdonensis DS-58]|uniref:DUF4142 domain containing protein n=1 Tax=Lysobacter dokdonensis DS-58 TaxID=1300345 RepID=A0A0A2WD05_9GAMM|nr:DUF4124 domain-containing protein [Lysobacter dokdonensis]KGQ18041.1 DUF4142 domain containing protein [Lysobacter dokdonensis DS-58]